MDELALEQRFLSPDQVGNERVATRRAGLRLDSPWEAHPSTITANLGEPFGEFRFSPETRS